MSESVAKVVMRDVARAAGVSKQTVSTALAGKKGVTTVIRDRVRMIAAKTGYPHTLAMLLPRLC